MKTQFVAYILCLVVLYTSCKKDSPGSPQSPGKATPPSEKLFLTLLWESEGGFSEITAPPPKPDVILFVNTIAGYKKAINRVRIIFLKDSVTEEVYLDTALTDVESFTKKITVAGVYFMNYKGTGNLTFKAIAFQNDGQVDTSSVHIQKPSVYLTWDNGSGKKNTNGVVQAGSKLDLEMSFVSSVGFTYTSARIDLIINGSIVKKIWDSTRGFSPNNATSLVKTIKDYPIPILAGAKLDFIVNASEGNSVFSNGQSKFTHTVTGIPGASVQTVENIKLGAQINTTTRGFFNPLAGKAGVMTLAQATAAQSDVHIIYHFNNTVGYKAAISSSINGTVSGLFPAIYNWKTRNLTLFRKTTLTSADFDKIQPSQLSVIDKECLNFSFGTIATDLKVGDVVAYINHNYTHYALFKITSINAGEGGDITFDMKSQVF